MISLFSLSPAASPPRPPQSAAGMPNSPLSSAGTFGVSFTPATTGFLGSGSVVSCLLRGGGSPGSVTGCFAGVGCIGAGGFGIHWLGFAVAFISNAAVRSFASAASNGNLGIPLPAGGYSLYLILAPRCHPTPSTLSMWASG